MISITPRTERIVSWILILLFVIFALAYASAPPLENIDESLHLNYSRTIAATGFFPDRTVPTTASVEFFQPPLYYLIPTLFIRLTGNASDFFDIIDRRVNPAWIPVGSRNGPTPRVYGDWQGVNHYFHRASEMLPFPTSPTAQATYITRLYGVFLVTLALLMALDIFKLLFPERPDRRLLALGLLTLWPNIQYQSAVISNDVLGITLGTAAVLLMLRIINGQESWKAYLLLGAALGAALITKASLAALGGPALALMVIKRRSWPKIAVLSVATLLMSGWWYFFTGVYYNDPTGLLGHSIQAEKAIVKAGQYSLLDMANRMVSVGERMWSYLGAHNAQIAPPPIVNAWFYALTVIAALGALMGLIAAWRKGTFSMNTAGVILSAYAVALFASVFWFQSRAIMGNQPHHVYQGMTIWGAFGAYGLSNLIQPRWWMRQLLSVLAVSAACCVLTLLWAFMPAYRIEQPPFVIANPLGYQFEGIAELVGSDRYDYVAKPGGALMVTLYWRAMNPTDAEDLYVTIMGGKGSRIVYYEHPAAGRVSANFWEPGLAWTEIHTIPIPADTPPGEYALLAGLIDPTTRRILKSTDADGRASPWQIGTLVIEPAP